MPPFGRRCNDPVVDMIRSTAFASPQSEFSFAALEFSEILVPQDDGRIQIRRIERGGKMLMPIDPDSHSSFQTLRTAIGEAFRRPGEPNTTARFLSHEGLRLKVVPIETTKGGLYICRRVRQTPAFTSIEGIANPIRAHLSTLGHTQQSGLLLVSGLPNSGKMTTVLAIALHLAKISEDVALVVEGLPEVRLDGVVQGSEGRVVQVRAVADPALYEDYLRTLLTLSPRFAAVGSITSALDARLALDLAMAGMLVVTKITANDIPGAIGNFISRASLAIGVDAARDAVALTLRGVMHQSLGDQDTSDDPNMRKLNVTSLFLPKPGDNLSLMRKIKEDKLQSLAPDITFQDTRIRNNQLPLEDREFAWPEAGGGASLAMA